MSNMRPCREIYRPKGARASTSTINAATSSSPANCIPVTSTSSSRQSTVHPINNGSSSANGSIRSSASSNDSLSHGDSITMKDQEFQVRNNNNRSLNNDNHHKRQIRKMSNIEVDNNYHHSSHSSRFDPQDPPAHLMELLNSVEMSIKSRNEKYKQQQQQHQLNNSRYSNSSNNNNLNLSRSVKFSYPPSVEANPQLVSLLDEFKSPDDRSLLCDALDSHKSLGTMQIMKVVRLIHHKALESSANAYPMTWVSFFILEKDQSKMFLESLLTCCKEWFSEIESELIARTNSTSSSPLLLSSSSTPGSSVTSYHKSWSSFLAFLRELYLVMQQKKNQLVTLTGSKGNYDDTGRTSNTNANNRANRAIESYQLYLSKQSLTLANLLLDAALSLFRIRSNDYNLSLDIESTVSMLRVVGSYLEQDNWSKMQQLMNVFRGLLIDPKTANNLSSMNKKNLMEIIEFRACRWLFNQNQQVYYFPYTKF